MTNNTLRIFFVCFVLTLFMRNSHSAALTGKVVDNEGRGIPEALVRLLPQGLSTTSDVNGNWNLSTAPIHKDVNFENTVKLGSHQISFFVNKPNTRVEASLFFPNDKLAAKVLDKTLSSGSYSLFPLSKDLSPGMYVLALKIDNTSKTFPMVLTRNRRPGPELVFHSAEPRHPLSKKSPAADTLKASKTGYLPAVMVLETLPTDSITLILNPDPGSVSYHLPGPDSCSNQFYAEGCVWEDPNSACGGVCAVANSCSPPESPDKGDLPKTFICPRFMIFSQEMRQAEIDDARLYGWSAEDPPFAYGIAGHDADVGGLDENNSSCCQCYQLIFESPEPSSPQFPELPQPPSMIVQSFNTAASGPKGFDLFMGAGGYGAFNACYDDPNFNNTSNFDEFMYQGYPYQNPNMGGISFLRYSECQSQDWPPTLAALESQTCQDKIAEQCSQALMQNSSIGTDNTRQSCRETNNPLSLYHQNWQVRAKRVQCPENLTRVTGCRLQEPDLPLPLPEVQSAADAEAEGSFTAGDAGYHTTTMQDCCKPTCAWQDWVEGQGLTPEPPWNSFYSCDKDGEPITR